MSSKALNVRFVHHGDFKKTEKFLKAVTGKGLYASLESYAQRGVQALSSATPVDTGKTAASWGYEIHTSRNQISIEWTNSNINKGVNIAVILQYGHGTRNGGYVKGRDYINPAIRPIFDEIANAVWEEVQKA